MKFKLLAGDELLGYSDLDGADPSMGCRIGKFVPHENYLKYRDLFRSYLKARESINGAELPAEVKMLQGQIESLNLNLQTDSGEDVGTMFIDLLDFSEELAEDGCELSIAVDDRATYEKFFD